MNKYWKNKTSTVAPISQQNEEEKEDYKEYWQQKTET